ncbi:hypothetical protein [Arthrobacter sp. B6]|uniref:hypothetical protein n=1 Tax=Arthrobacter sp. B6 TaxID=1570137 RepID=UPI000830D606|nr:hypothetical protein [Arthrobacter sp. B6]
MAHGDGPSGSAGDGTDSAAPSQVEAQHQGIMVIRTWWEPEHAHGFRARVTSIQPAEAGPTTVTTADPDEVLAVVRRWLLARPGTAGSQ